MKVLVEVTSNELFSFMEQIKNKNYLKTHLPLDIFNFI